MGVLTGATHPPPRGYTREGPPTRAQAGGHRRWMRKRSSEKGAKTGALEAFSACFGSLGRWLRAQSLGLAPRAQPAASRTRLAQAAVRHRADRKAALARSLEHLFQ